MIGNSCEDRKISGRRSCSDRRASSDPDYRGPERRIAQRRTQTDKRKHVRYRVKDHIYVSLRSETEEEVGQILDISKGGLSLHYVGTNGELKKYSDLGIFSSMDLAVERISFRGVSDIGVGKDLKINYPNLRRYSLQFENLTPEQEAKLDYFIENFTLGEA